MDVGITAEAQPPQPEPFIDDIYFIGAVLDPQYMLHWVDADVVTAEDVDNTRAVVKDSLKGMLALAHSTCSLRQNL